MRKLSSIIVHCSDTKKNMNTTVDDIRRWHVKERGWDDIGYHYVIHRDGSVMVGRDIEKAGAHARGHNGHSVGVCLVGGRSDKGTPLFNYTDSQMYALSDLIEDLMSEHGELKVMGHNDVSNKACPCFDVGVWWYGDN